MVGVLPHAVDAHLRTWEDDPCMAMLLNEAIREVQKQQILEHTIMEVKSVLLPKPVLRWTWLLGRSLEVNPSPSLEALARLVSLVEHAIKLSSPRLCETTRR